MNRFVAVLSVVAAFMLSSSSGLAQSWTIASPTTNQQIYWLQDVYGFGGGPVNGLAWFEVTAPNCPNPNEEQHGVWVQRGSWGIWQGNVECPDYETGWGWGWGTVTLYSCKEVPRQILAGPVEVYFTPFP